jgi:hypothetical protein
MGGIEEWRLGLAWVLSAILLLGSSRAGRFVSFKPSRKVCFEVKGKLRELIWKIKI